MNSTGTPLDNATIAEIHRIENAEDPELAITLGEGLLPRLRRSSDRHAQASVALKLGLAYSGRSLGDQDENLEKAIAYYSESIGVVPKEGRGIEANAAINLGTAYHLRRAGDKSENMEHAISYNKRALNCYSKLKEQEAVAEANLRLGNSYALRIRGNKQSNLSRAIRYIHAAIADASPHTDLWARAHLSLGTAYGERAKSRRDLDRSDQAFHEAITAFPRETHLARWAEVNAQIGIQYAARRSGDTRANLLRAASHLQAALEGYTPEDSRSTWSLLRGALGDVWSLLADDGDPRTIDTAITFIRATLDSIDRSDEPERWQEISNQLAGVYMKRLNAGTPVNIEGAIELWRGVVEAGELEESDRLAAQANLGAAYRMRTVGEKADNLERAIHHLSRAAQGYKRHSEEWAWSQRELGVVYLDRTVGNAISNAEMAVRCFEEALAVYAEATAPKDWAQTQLELATAYVRLASERNDLLDKAVSCLESSLKVWTRELSPSSWALATSNLAIVLLRRGTKDDVGRAIGNLKHALEIYDIENSAPEWARVQHNLALAYGMRDEMSPAERTEHALVHFEEALRVYEREQYPVEYCQTVAGIADSYMDCGDWTTALDWLDRAIEGREELLATSFTGAGRQSTAAHISKLQTMATWCLLELRLLSGALVRLETSRAQLLKEALLFQGIASGVYEDEHARSVGMAWTAARELEGRLRAREKAREWIAESIPSKIDAFVLGDELVAMGDDDVDLRDQLRGARRTLAEFVRSVVARESSDDEASVVQSIIQSIPVGGAIVYPLITSRGGAAFVLPASASGVSEAHVVPLPQLTVAAVLELLAGSTDQPPWTDALGDDAAAAAKVIDAVTGDLWSLLMGPIHERLIALAVPLDSEVVFAQSGLLAMLPIHAAWRQNGDTCRRAVEDWTISIVPAAFVRTVARDRLASQTAPTTDLLAISNPSGDLRFTETEVLQIMDEFGSDRCKILGGWDARKRAVIHYAPGSNYIHFACHGNYGWTEPQESRIVLAGGDSITLSDIVSTVDLHACRLVTLSACTTGISDLLEAPDEFIGLPGGFLQAGTAGVLGSLWLVNDLSTCLLLAYFYHQHIHERQAPAVALRSAQQWLRRATRRELTSRLRERAVANPGSDLAQAYAELLLDGEPEDRPFEQSYFWAPFTMFGV